MKRSSHKPWLVCMAVAIAGLLRTDAADPAAVTNATPATSNPAATNLSLSASAGLKRAAWQQHMTLGPGDVLSLALFQMPDTMRKDVPVGPDGRISFLQARDVVAAGLTIDELRSKLDQALSTYYQTPRTIITPTTFRSKKYYLLGAVVGSGVYPLDRPLTIVEALARAGGLETGMYERNTVEMADLSHSFLVRNSQHMPVDFERLFQRGDLSQNVALEPDDYVYFALATANEIYVLGEVSFPGTAAFLPRTSLIAAISARGGFTPRAYKTRVLVVRGSLNQPETFVVNTSEIVKGKAPDFRLQPRDIVYVSQSPWVRAGELVDMAAMAFIQGVVVGTTTRKVGPAITEPIIP
jgi:protein involved in polysaccharide export with SLBB domain